MCNDGGPTLSPKSRVAITATQNNPLVQPTITGLASQANADVTLSALGIAYTAYFSFASTLTAATLNNISVSFVVAGEVRQSFLGAELAATNANACMVNACGKGVCVGSLEPLVVRVTNISGAALAAGETMVIRLQRYFPGDGDKYMCDTDEVKAQRDMAGACRLPTPG